MSRLLASLLLLAACPTLAQLTPATEIIPVLPFVFFDSARAEIPGRYRLLNAAEIASFDETQLGADIHDHHHNVLNVIGSRMRAQPSTRISIVGCNSEQPLIGEVIEVSAGRGVAIRDYLMQAWGIDSSRLTLEKPRGFPLQRSNPKDPQGIVENRRAEILSEDWRLMRPVEVRGALSDAVRRQLNAVKRADVPWIDLAYGDGTIVTAWLIRFRFDSYEMGPVNRRIVEFWIAPKIASNSHVLCLGTADQERHDETRTRGIHLQSGRALETANLLKKTSPEHASIVSAGTGEPPVSSETPEGRFYNRGVAVHVYSPRR